MLIKPDIITVWPRAYDYPFWRWSIKKNRQLFNQVIVTFTHNSVERDFREFIKTNHPDFTYVENEEYRQDEGWYGTAVNNALDASTGKWVLFLEQDFIYEEDFLERLFSDIQDVDFIAYQQTKRLHPACFLVKKEMVNRTHRFFDPIYNMDCFDFFANENVIISKNNFLTLEHMGFNDPEDYHHLNGLTHNYYLLSLGKKQEITNMEEFKKYNQMCKTLSVEHNKEWMEIINRI
jgi:glycosyltransferase involved in cell wall biosynthesis